MILLRIFFFAASPNFFFVYNLGNRFRLADIGGAEPLRKLVRQNLTPSSGSNMSDADGGLAAEVSKPGNCSRDVYLGDHKYVIRHSWRPHTLGRGGGVQLTTTLLDSKGRSANTKTVYTDKTYLALSSKREEMRLKLSSRTNEIGGTESRCGSLEGAAAAAKRGGPQTATYYSAPSSRLYAVGGLPALRVWPSSGRSR